MERICEKHGDKPFALMKPEHIRALRDEKDTPDASNMRLKALRALFKWAVEAKEAQHNPAKQVEMMTTNSDGYHTWTRRGDRAIRKPPPDGYKGAAGDGVDALHDRQPRGRCLGWDHSTSANR